MQQDENYIKDKIRWNNDVETIIYVKDETRWQNKSKYHEKNIKDATRGKEYKRKITWKKMKTAWKMKIMFKMKQEDDQRRKRYNNEMV